MSGYSNIRDHCVALSEHDGVMKFFANPGSPSTNALVFECSGSPVGDLVEVKVSTLNNLWESLGNPDIAFLKIDVEGFEPSVIRGGDRMFHPKKCAAALVEFCPNNLAAAGSSVEALLAMIHQVDYSLRFLQEDGSPGELINTENGTRVLLCNAVMLPNPPMNLLRVEVLASSAKAT